MQEGLFELLNLDKLANSLANNLEPSPQNNTLSQNNSSSSNFESDLEELIPLDLKGLQNSSFSKEAKISRSYSTNTAQPSISANTKENLNQIFEFFVQDILKSRDKLISLNPGRRKTIEKRLEYIGRKIARLRGEKLNKTFSLIEILKESYKEALPTVGPSGVASNSKVSHLAWHGFVLEVALFQILELFTVKLLDKVHWRSFETADLGRLHFSIHSFLNQRSAQFACDKHAWNFVRAHVYSWYIPSSTAIEKITPLLKSNELQWTSSELTQWLFDLDSKFSFPHYFFKEDYKTSEFLQTFIENEIGFSNTTVFQDKPVCKKIFFPCLEMGWSLRQSLKKTLGELTQLSKTLNEKALIFDEKTQLSRALWSCESESFELFFSETLVLLDFIETANKSLKNETGISTFCLYRIPQFSRFIQSLGLELHNLVQLPLSSSAEVGTYHQGSAAQLQQLESFDLAVVLDHPDRQKSNKWLKALSEQLSYWQQFATNSSNLNWGELHLALSLSKLKDNGSCLYLSHKVLPEGGDGEKLRKWILNQATLECFVELPEEAHPPYKYLYFFKKNPSKLEREQHKPKFGHLKTLQTPLKISLLEEANSSQLEILEKGWDHLFVRGSGPLLRHLQHKFPKLYQVASVQSYSLERIPELFSGVTQSSPQHILEVSPKSQLGQIDGLNFQIYTQNAENKKSSFEPYWIIPHNPVDVSWIQCLLNSPPVQFWIKTHLLQLTGPHKPLKLSELKSCPLPDLSHAPADLVHEAIELIGTFKNDSRALRLWACAEDLTLTEKYARFTALSRKYLHLSRVLVRYRNLFTSTQFDEFAPEAISKFYPPSLLVPLFSTNEVKCQYFAREKTTLSPEYWTISEIQLVQQAGSTTIVIETKQGPVIQLFINSSINATGLNSVGSYIASQFNQLKDYPWGEAISLIRFPKDLVLFAAQTQEISRVVQDTFQQCLNLEKIMNESSLGLFEIPNDMQQFLFH